MRKLLLGLLAIIIVIVIGIVTLIVVIDPNEYRGYITKQVRQSSGYELTLNGDLRWHIWPQISILSDGIVLKAPGAKTPILQADNMRLDVDLMPLFSKHIAINQVMVKGAVITLNDESKGEKKATNNVTVNETVSENKQTDPQPWQLRLSKVEIVDGVVSWQKSDHELVNVRDINILLTHDDPQQAELQFGGRIDQDKKTLNFNLDATANIANLPDNLTLSLNKLSYQFNAPGMPDNGIEGTLTGQFDYQASSKQLTASKLELSANQNRVTGHLLADLAAKPAIDLTLSSNKIDLNSLLPAKTQDNSKSEPAGNSTVIAQQATSRIGNELNGLKNFDLVLKASIKQLLLAKGELNNIRVDLNNKNGIATINQIGANVYGGEVKASGSANGNSPRTDLKLNIALNQIDLAKLLSQLAMPEILVGQLNGTSNLTMTALSADKLLSATSGNLDIAIDKARLNNINIQQIIQMAVMARLPDIQSKQQHFDRYTEVRELQVKGQIRQGQVNITSLSADSDILQMKGNGSVNLVDSNADFSLAVKILQGWQGNKNTLAKLQQATIPLRIYGDLSQLHYELDIEKLIKDQLRTEIRQQLEKLINKNSESKGGEALNNLLDKLKR